MILSGEDKTSIMQALTGRAIAFEHAGDNDRAAEAWALSDRFLDACAFDVATESLQAEADQLAAVAAAA